MTHKILLTWLVFFIPIWAYGFYEIAKTNYSIRWFLLTIWMTGVLLISIWE